MSDEPSAAPISAELEIKDLVRREPGSTEDALSTEKLNPAAQLRGRNMALDIQLKKTYGTILLWAMVIQLLIADLVFVAFAQFGTRWELSAGVVNVWLGATLVEVIGIVLVVTRYLFSSRGLPE